MDAVSGEGVRLVPVLDDTGVEMLSGGAGFCGGAYEQVGLSPSSSYARRHQDWQDDREAERYEEQRLGGLSSHRAAAEAMGLGRTGRTGRTHGQVLGGLVDGDRRRTIADERAAEAVAEHEGRASERELYEQRRRRSAREAAAARKTAESAPASRADLAGLRGQVAALAVRLGRAGR